MARPVVAVVGRPNVGKSTLFNRLIGERLAIVEDLPGTTRDRLYGTVEWNGRELSLVDTGGLDDEKAEIPKAVRKQAEAAIQEADVVLLLVDAKTGIVPVDHDVAELLRRSGKRVILAANKADSWRGEAQAAEFYELGLGEVHPVSALQGHGTGDLLDAVVAALPPERTVEDEESEPRIAIVGRPNVGKSSFLNRLVGEERAVVSEEPGTTRDTIDTTLVHDGRRVRLVDTAGIRRRGRIEQGIEQYALLRTIHALERADVAILLVDATEGITAQDTHVAGYAIEAGVGLVLALNKWDAVERSEESTHEMEAVVAREFHFAPWMGHRFVSAKTGRNVIETLEDALDVVAVRTQRIATSDLHRLLVDAIASHPPPSDKGRQVRFRYVTQAKAATPTFVFFVDRPESVHFTYQRYLENKIRERFEFVGTPMRIELRGARD
ncbi:MAG: ribosome biogenesis GTPase Der [Chloroflexota bacterium]|nr:ribosome biogenesis GTPase Der [Chloroflexota bacterium]